MSTGKKKTEEVWFFLLCTKLFTGFKGIKFKCHLFAANLKDQTSLVYMLSTPCIFKIYFLYWHV
jgi:hypothetical protein